MVAKAISKTYLAASLYLLVLSLLFAVGASAQDFSPSYKVIYKHADTRDLNLWVWDGVPKEESSSSLPSRGALILFHGGGWRAGSPSQFAPLCKRLSDLGYLAISAEYQIANDGRRIDIDPMIQDVESAIEWVRTNAPALRVDPHKIAVGGGSAGGFLALAAAMLDDGNGAGKSQKKSRKPDALILFNPMFNVVTFRQRNSVAEPVKISLADETGAVLPPTLIMHGTADKVSSFKLAEKFTHLAREKGSPQIELVSYEGREHGFFNYRKGGNPDFRSALDRVDKFLKSLGWISVHAAK